MSFPGRSVFLAGAATLAAAVPFQATRVASIDDIAVASAPLEFPEVAMPAVPKPPEWSEALARPLFSPERRPFVPQAVMPEAALPDVPGAVEAAPRPEPLSVVGVFIHGTGRRALLVSPSRPEGEWLRVGSKIAGWEVMRIERNSVALAQSGDALTLQLNVDNTPPE